MAGFVFQGTSGQRYEYMLLQIDLISLVPQQAGNYILAKGNPTDPKPLLIESADNVRKSLQDQVASGAWQIATDVYAVTSLFARFDQSADVRSRLREKIDLIDFYRPPMNR